MKKCKVENCNNNDYKHYVKGYCGRHNGQIYNYGKILQRTKFDKNEIINCGDYYEICLYDIKHKEIARTKIDIDDLEKVKNYKWGLNCNRYPYNNKNKIFLHHLIIGKPLRGYEIDHKDTNPLNNRKYNLRFATPQENKRNRKNKGYYWHKQRNKWMAQITVNYKRIHLGYFKKEKEVKKIVQEARQKYFKDYAYKENN